MAKSCVTCPSVGHCPVGADADTLTEISNSLGRYTLKGANRVMFQEGQPLSCLSILCQGSVKLVKTAAGGTEVVVDIIRAGSILGGVPVSDGVSVQPCSAISIADSAEVAVLQYPELLRAFSRSPKLAHAFARHLASRVANSYEFRTHCGEPTAKRILAALASFARGNGTEFHSGKTVTVGLSSKELAQFVHTTPQTLSKQLRGMVTKGLIGIRRREITILNSEAFKRYSTVSRD